MRIDLEHSPSARLLVISAAFIIVVAGMRAAESLLVPFLLSVFIAVICGPVLFWMQRRGVPLIVAMLLVIAFILGLVALIAALVGSSVDDFSRNIPHYQTRLNTQTSGLVTWLTGLGVPIPPDLLANQFNPSKAMNVVAGVLKGFTGALTNTFLILLTVIFILMEASSFPKKLRSVLDNPETSMSGFHTFAENVKQYVVIKTITSLATGGILALWLMVLGVDYPLLWGLLAFMLNYVPSIGSIIAAVPAVLLALIQLGPGPALLAVAGYAVVNIVIGSIIEPRFLGKGLGLSALIVFLSLVFWGWVLGPVGMLLSVPLTMTVKIALDSNDETRWIAVLLGPAQPPEHSGSKRPEPISSEPVS